jgi:hypothetical protein
MMRPLPCRLSCLAAALVLFASAGSARQAGKGLPLPIGKMEGGTATDGNPAVYTYTATTAGVLSVAVAGTGDLAIRVIDEDEQQVPEGSTDMDRFDSVGNEQLAVTLTEPGVYRIIVRMQEQGASKFQIGAAWIPFPGFAQASDPDRRPGQARVIDIGKSYEDSLGTPASDRWDWFAFEPKTAGALTIITRALADSKVDLGLEVYLASDLSKPVVKSDQDLQGSEANESVTLDVTPGQKIVVKVTGASGGTSGKYRISSSMIQ